MLNIKGVSKSTITALIYGVVLAEEKYQSFNREQLLH